MSDSKKNDHTPMGVDDQTTLGSPGPDENIL